MHARGDLPSARRRFDDEGAPIGRANVTGDEAASGQPVENARQRRPFVRQASVQIRDRCRAGHRQVCEDVRFALRQAELTEIGEIQADSVRRSMDRRDETQWHRR